MQPTIPQIVKMAEEATALINKAKIVVKDGRSIANKMPVIDGSNYFSGAKESLAMLIMAKYPALGTVEEIQELIEGDI